MTVFYNVRVPIPKEHVTIRHTNNCPVEYVLEQTYDKRKKTADIKRTIIGYVCADSPNMMFPNSQYRQIFPDEWSTNSNEPATPAYKKIGMYCALKAINNKEKIIDLVKESFGDEISDSILDFAMYSILHKSATLSLFQKSMSEQMLFNKSPKSDSYYSNLFQKEISQSSILKFKKSWALHCRTKGIDNVWLCIDGSNDDCTSKGVELAEKGHAKSHKNINIVSFSYAVTSSGLPVTFNVYRGGLVDAKAMKQITDFLQECNIGIRGVILDRGYCNSKAIKFLCDNKIPYIVIVKGSPLGAEQIVTEYGEAIKGNASYFIEGTTLFGVQKPYQIFKDYKHIDYLTLFFDCTNASDRITTLMKKINREKSRLVNALATYTDKLLNYYSRALKLIDEGKDVEKENLVKPELPKVSDNLKDFLSIKVNAQSENNKSDDGKSDNNKSSQYEVTINTENFQNAINRKGLYSILSSEELSPADIDKLYSSRSSSEIQYKIFKTELGYGTTRIHFTSSLYSKFAVGFISSIIRYQMQLHARSIDQSTSSMIREMNMLSEIKINDVYTFSHIENKRQLSFLEFFGCSETLIDKCVKEDNDRIAGRRPTPSYRKPGPKPKDKTNDKNRSPVASEISGSEVSTGASDRPNSPHTQENSSGNANLSDLTVTQSSCEQSDIQPHLSAEPKKRGVKPGTQRGDFNKDGTPRKKPGVQVGTKRNLYKNDGSLRQKPGPKPRNKTVV